MGAAGQARLHQLELWECISRQSFNPISGPLVIDWSVVRWSESWGAQTCGASARA